jgi:hypothetical protein
MGDSLRVLAISVHFKSTFITNETGCTGTSERLPKYFDNVCYARLSSEYEPVSTWLGSFGIPNETIFTLPTSALYMMSFSGEHSSVMLYTASQNGTKETLEQVEKVAMAVRVGNPGIIELNMFIHSEDHDTYFFYEFAVRDGLLGMPLVLRVVNACVWHARSYN